MSHTNFVYSADKIKHKKDGSCFVSMKQDEVLMFSGYIRVYVAKGVIEINGYQIDANNNKNNKNNDDSSKYYNVYSVPYWKHMCLSIKAIKESQIEFRPFDFKRKYRIKKTSKTCDSIFKVIGCHFITNDNNESDEYQPLLIPQSWRKISNHLVYSSPNIDNNASIMICGRIQRGKSTFSRYLINCFLNKYSEVAYLDCDIGQSEFNPEGIISISIIKNALFGASHTHQFEKTNYYPWKSLYFGSNNPNDNPSLYLQCIAQLYTDWSQSQHNIPLIINCNGWVSGLGANILKSMIVTINPHHLIEMYNKKEPLLSGVEMDYLTEVKHIFIHQNKIHNWCDIDSNDTNDSTSDHNNSVIGSWWKQLTESDPFEVKEYQSLKPTQKKWFKYLEHLMQLKFEDGDGNDIGKWYHNINVSKGRNIKNTFDLRLFKAFINAHIHYVESVHVGNNNSYDDMKHDNDERIKRIIALRKERQTVSIQKRLLYIASYFTQQLFVDNVSQYLRETDCYKVPFDDIYVMFLEHSMDDIGDDNRGLLLHALNGVIVGLGIVESKHDDEPPTKKRKMNINDECEAKVMDSADYDCGIECVGLGIIRSINVKKQCFYLITPVRPSELDRVNVFIRGKTNIPSIFLYDSSMLTAPLYINSSPTKERVLTSTC